MTLTQMTLSGGAFILFVLMVRALALHRLPKASLSALWEMAALRLLLPFSIPLPLGIPAPLSRLPGVESRLTTAAVPAPAGPDPHVVLPVVWMAGTALMAVYFAVLYVRGIRTFRTSVPDGAPAVERWLAAQKLRRPLEIRQSDQVSSPLTYGIFRPVILLPKEMDRGDEKALACILTHELVHVRRFDAAAKLVFAAALCVHWFNPLVWAMYVLANRDLELSCDERVMDLLGGREKAHYALTLINMEETRGGFSLCNHFSKLAIEERIEAVMKYKKASVMAAVLAVVLVAGATTAFAASAAGPAEKDEAVGEIGMKFYDYKLVLEGTVDSLDEKRPVFVASREEKTDSDPVAIQLEEAKHVKLEDFEVMTGMLTLVAVRPEDESRFTPEEWAEILEKIDRGEIRWQTW